MPWRARLALLRLAASLPASAALLHAVGAIVAGVILLVEPPGGYTVRVWDGPRGIAPLWAWGAAFLIAGVLVLGLRGGPASRWALAALAGLWATFAGGALVVGATSGEAALMGGWAFALLAAGCARAAFEFVRWPRCLHDHEG